MKTLVLLIKKKWFDMIKSGEKKEEYVRNTAYWEKRLFDYKYDRKIDCIEFRNGYGKNVPKITVELIDIRLGYPYWGWTNNHYEICYI